VEIDMADSTPLDYLPRMPRDKSVGIGCIGAGFIMAGLPPGRVSPGRVSSGCDCRS
jgi:hypothetical protein